METQRTKWYYLRLLRSQTLLSDIHYNPFPLGIRRRGRSDWRRSDFYLPLPQECSGEEYRLRSHGRLINATARVARITLCQT